jgi:S1-C subfamily serine protease
VAVLKVDGDDLPAPLALGSTEGVRTGDEIVVLGSPRGLSGTLSTGIVSAIRAQGLDGGLEGERSAQAWAIQITAAISPGSSGSPVMTREGEVIGVAVGLMEGGGSLNFAVPIEVVQDLLADLPADAQVKAFTSVGGGVAQNLILSAVFFVAVALAFVAGAFFQKRAKRRG